MKKFSKEQILLATSNPHKAKEIGEILGMKVIAYSLPVKEDGQTFEENAVKKAVALMRATEQVALADDSGLLVDCLAGQPGVRSARFASPPTSLNLCSKLLRKMKNCTKRQARFVCVIAVAYPNGKVLLVKGVCHGRIAWKMRGRGGFGYDPVFIPRGYRRTFAELSPRTKNRISHRAAALRRLKKFFAKK